MNRALLASLAVVLVVGMVPIATAEEEDPDEERCIEPPNLNESYEWSYELSNGRTQFIEVIDEGPATTPRGHHNITKLEFLEEDADGQTKAWGQTARFAPDSPYPWGLVTQDRWEQTEKGQLRRMDSYDPPFQVTHWGQETCPDDFWRFTTHHQITYGEYGQQGNQSGEETWQARALAWTNITVPEGEHEVLPVTAVREQDEHRITTYWSPEARAPALVEQGPAGTTELTRELSWYILDQRPNPIFQVLPEHPEVGDELVLNGTASWDLEGNITGYRWLVGGETYHGPLVELNLTEERALDIRLFVTDEANRTSTLGTTRYVAPAEGSGVGVSGPERAFSGQILTLEAHASFDPIDVRWRVNDTVVGEGETFSFRMEETRTVHVDAFHESGRVATANHTVELVERGNSSEGQDGDTASYYPPGGSEELAILEPLEGQLVPQRFDAQVRAKASATLTADGRPIWQGTADPSETVTIEDLPPGQHTLRLESASASQMVNITVAGDGADIAGKGAEASDQGSGNGSTASPVPAPSVALVAGLAAAVAIVGRRR